MCVRVCVDMGSGLYAASKAIAFSDLITTVTPERRTDERKEEQGKEITNEETYKINILLLYVL